MFKRKKLIDKSFQLRTTFSIIGIIIIALISLIAVTGIILSDYNRRIYRAISELSPAIARQSPLPARERVLLAERNVQTLHDLQQRNRIILSTMIITTVLLGVFLYFYLINLTNRISGPIYVLSNIVRDLMEGRKPDTRSLRKNDEFKDFYRQFIELVDRVQGDR